MQGREGTVSLTQMVDTQVALLWGSGLCADEEEYRRGWPTEVDPIRANRIRFPLVVPVDTNIARKVVLDHARIAVASDADPVSFVDIPEAVAKTNGMRRYVIYADDGFGRFGMKPATGVATLQPDELPLTLTEGMYLVLHHARSHVIRHGIVCAGSRNADGRYPVISAVSRGYLLYAVDPNVPLYRQTVGSKGSFIPSSF